MNPLGALIALASLAVLYGLLARTLDRVGITGPMVFVAGGALVGPAMLGLDQATLSTQWVRTVAELTLAVTLFVDASTVRLRDAARGIDLPGRLLGIGLPLTALAGALMGLLVLPGLGWAVCALLACVLAPTDAALGVAVVENEAVPRRIRQALNIESGLNDGLATPFVTLLLAVVASEERHGDWVSTSLKAIGFAIVLGAAIGLAVGAASRLAAARGWLDDHTTPMLVVITPLLCFGVSTQVGGNGFVGAYVCGFVFAEASRRELVPATRFAEDVGLYASFAVWSIFGMLFVGPVLHAGVSWRVLAYAAASLTVVRMGPVALAMLGMGFRRSTTAFVGWFGPRGLASVVFTLIVVETLEPNAVRNTVLGVATLTVLGSIVLHGVTAGPLARRYGASITAAGPDSLELDDTGGHVRVRRRSLAKGAQPPT